MKKFNPIVFSILILLVANCNRQDNSSTPSEIPHATESNLPPGINALIDRSMPSDEEIIRGQFLPLKIMPPDLSDTSWDIYAVTLLWGHLLNLGSADSCTTTDWSGSLSINGFSIIAPVKSINFESGQDSILQEEDSAYAAWASAASGDYDGIACLVFLKRGVEYFAAPWLTFATQPITLELDFGRLENLTAFYRVDDINALALRSRRIWPHQCAEGSLIGNWIKTDNTGDSGYFNGEWLDENGNQSGVFSGYFRTTDNGLRIFEGWISHPILDVIIGHMSGVWYYDDPRDCVLCGTGYGRFKGIFKYFNEPRVGYIEGEMFEHSIGSLDMTLKGQWQQFCLFEADYTSDDIF